MGVESEFISLAYTIPHTNPWILTAVHMYALTKKWFSRFLVVIRQTTLYSFLGAAHLGGFH